MTLKISDNGVSRDATPEEIAQAKIDAEEAKTFRFASARDTRDNLLAKTDWTQAKDIPDAVSAKWAPYRQALRDVPQQAGFPENIVWPSKP